MPTPDFDRRYGLDDGMILDSSKLRPDTAVYEDAMAQAGPFGPLYAGTKAPQNSSDDALNASPV